MKSSYKFLYSANEFETNKIKKENHIAIKMVIFKCFTYQFHITASKLFSMRRFTHTYTPFSYVAITLSYLFLESEQQSIWIEQLYDRLPNQITGQIRNKLLDLLVRTSLFFSFSFSFFLLWHCIWTQREEREKEKRIL